MGNALQLELNERKQSDLNRKMQDLDTAFHAEIQSKENNTSSADESKRNAQFETIKTLQAQLKENEQIITELKTKNEAKSKNIAGLKDEFKKELTLRLQATEKVEK